MLLRRHPAQPHSESHLLPTRKTASFRFLKQQNLNRLHLSDLSPADFSLPPTSLSQPFCSQVRLTCRLRLRSSHEAPFPSSIRNVSSSPRRSRSPSPPDL